MEEHHHHEDTIKLKKSSIWKITTVVLGLAFIISLGFNIFGGDGDITGNAVAQPGNNNPTPTGVANVRAEDFIDDDPVLGDENAPLTIVEFSDFQCPFCARFHSQTLSQIKTEYIDTGKVKFVYRDLPLTSIHPQAMPAAEASECADDQGKFWEYHDILFERQSSLSSSNYVKWAEELGLDTNEFQECLDSNKHKDEVNNDLRDASSAGGRGTPYFIVGNQALSGAQPFAAFQQAIEAQL
tara:strand:- start:20 stop:739 length:720 start_codon:yes stop_codon:yes gene_type:complete